MKRLIECVLLDLNNVGENYTAFEEGLPDVLRCVSERIAALFCVDAERLWAAVQPYRALTRSPLQHHPALWQYATEAVVSRRLTYVEVEAAYEVYLNEYTRRITPYDDFRRLLEWAERADLRTGVVANGNTKRVCRFLEKFDLQRYLDTVVVSNSTPFQKPDRDMFRLALLNVGVPPVRALFVGDRQDTDIVGAKRAGLWSVRLDRSRRTEWVESPGEEPDHRVSTLDAIPDLSVLALQHEITTAVIPCGGRGTRMGVAGEGRQKCMTVVGGKPVLAWVTERLVCAGVQEIWFIVGHREEDVRAYFGNGARFGFAARYEKPGEASTGGAIMRFATQLPERFVYCHGNIVVDAEMLCRLVRAAYQEPGESVFMVTRARIASTHPVFVLANGKVTAVRRNPDPLEADTTYFSIGAGVVRSHDLCWPGEGQSEVTAEQLCRATAVRAVPYEKPWYHLETPTDVVTCEDAIRHGSSDCQ